MHDRYLPRQDNQFTVAHSGHDSKPKEPEKIEESEEEAIEETDSSEIIAPSETKIESLQDNQNIRSNPVSNVSRPEFIPMPGLGEVIFILIIIMPFLLFSIKSKLYR